MKISGRHARFGIVFGIAVFCAIPCLTAQGADPARTAPGVRALTTAPLRFIGTGGQSGSQPDDAGMRSVAASPAPERALRIDTPTLVFLGAGSGSTEAKTTPSNPKTIQTQKLIFIGSAPSARPRLSQ